MDAPRVLFLNWRGHDDPLAGGAESYVMSVCRRLSSRGYSITLVCRRPRGFLREEVVDGVRVRRMGGPFTLYLRVAWAYLTGLRNECDVIVESINGVPFFSPLYARKPVIAIIHHITDRIFFRELPLPLAALGYLAERSIPLVYRGATMAAVSESTREDMVKLGMSDVAITGEGIEPPGAPARHNREQHPTVIYLGRVKKYKRIGLLIEACQLVREKHPELALWIVGTGDALAALREGAKGKDWVSFYGFADEPTKAELLSRAWLFATPTSKEGFGLTVVEANAYGLPAVGIDVAGIRDSISDGYSGLLVDEDTPSALASAIERLVSDDKLREKLSENAVEWAQRFSWDGVSDAISQLIEGCVDEGRGNRAKDRAD